MFMIVGPNAEANLTPFANIAFQSTPSDVGEVTFPLLGNEE